MVDTTVMDRLRQGGTLLVTAVVVVGLLVSTAGGASIDSNGERSGPSSLGPGTVPEANNSSVRHVDPDAASADGDDAALRNWLAGRMDRALIDCSQGVEVGDYDACNRSSNQYPEWLGMYVEVSGNESGGGSPTRNDSAARRFENAQENQTELAANVKQFRETRKRYREARRNGNNARARELARKLVRLSKKTTNNTAALKREYRAASANSSANFSGAITATDRIERNVTETAAQVRSQSFVETTLSADTDSETASFRDPLEITGSIETENGTALEKRPVEFAVGNRTIDTTTDEDGDFSIAYRPTWLPLDAREVRVQYVPANASALLGSSTNVPIDVERTTPTVRTTSRPGSASYNETITVTGSVGAEGVPASDVPVLVTLNGEPANATWSGTGISRTAGNSTVHTDSAGRFALTTRLPAGVAPGEATVRATIPWRGRALASANGTAALTVKSAETTLDASAEQIAGREVRVSGRLLTQNGSPIRGEEVTVRGDGAVLGTTTTTENGSYATTVLVPRAALAQRDGEPEATLVVLYDGTGTNLGPSRTRLTVPIAGLSVTDRWTVLVGTITESVSAVIDALTTLSSETLAFAGGLVALAGGLLLVRRWRARRSSDETDNADGTDSADSTDNADRDAETASGEASGSETGTDDGEGFNASFSPADWLFSGLPDEAITAAYAVVRSRLDGELGISSASTHREFYDACRNASMDGVRLAALRALVDAYERAAFAADSLTERTAREVLGRLASFEDDSTETAAETGDDDRHRLGDA